MDDLEEISRRHSCLPAPAPQRRRVRRTRNFFICPNPNCHYQGPPLHQGVGSLRILWLLFCMGALLILAVVTWSIFVWMQDDFWAVTCPAVLLALDVALLTKMCACNEVCPSCRMKLNR